ncbi:hypothetical protein AB0L64_39655 [Kribbella sp. NPDC051936]|uniref:hypothetical protein n=1 Tax=Kribbella sp. NPDC051936 TaxID=3154946 RepID=UPI0034201C69
MKLASHLFMAAWIVPQLIAVVGSAALRRTEICKRGTQVKSSSRSRILVGILAVVGVVALLAILVAGRQRSDEKPAESSGKTLTAGAPTQLEVWTPPATTDPQEFAIAYAQAIWTYDTSLHGYADWQQAVSAFADPASTSPQVARSLLPQRTEWDQLESQKARAVVNGVTAQVTPELEAMATNGRVPTGWHAYVVHGTQTVITNADTRFLDRQAAVAVVCTPTCRFWSATAQVSP